MNYQTLDQAVATWADTLLDAVEKELSGARPSSRAMLALEVNDAMKSAVSRRKRYPEADAMNIFSYRSGDMWKYQFAAPLMITKAAAEVLFKGINAREKAFKLIEGFKNKQTVIVHGEHAVPTSEQRFQIADLLIQKEAAGQLDTSRFPNTAYARELLLMNVIVCMEASESTHLSVKDLPNAADRWSRYHSHDGYEDIAPAIISRRWFQKKGGEDFHSMPEVLNKIAARIMKDHKPATFEEFWNLLTA